MNVVVSLACATHKSQLVPGNVFYDKLSTTVHSTPTQSHLIEVNDEQGESNKVFTMQDEESGGEQQQLPRSAANPHGHRSGEVIRFVVVAT